MKEGDGNTKEGEPASSASAAAAAVNDGVARANDDKERNKQMGTKATVAVVRFQDRLNEKPLTGALDTNTNINADMASDDASCSSGLKEEAAEKDEHVHEIVDGEGEGDLSDQPKGTTPASGDVISSSSAGVVRNDEGEMISANFTTINEDSIPIQPGVIFVPEPDSRGGVHSGYHDSAHEESDEDADADDDINVDIENQTQTTQTLIEAYPVPDDDEQAEISDQLHEQLGSARQELEQETQTKLELERGQSQLEGMPVVEGVPVSDIEDVPLLNNKKTKNTIHSVDNVKCNENDYIMKEGGGHMKEGEPASAAAAEVDKAEVARANDDEERKSKLMDSKAIAAVDRFQDRLNDKLLTGSLDTNTNINPHEDSDADDDINGDIENQTQTITTQTLIEAYTVPDDDEQAEISDQLHEQLSSARQELEQETQTKLELERGQSQLEGMPVVEGVPVSDIEDVPLLNNKKTKNTIHSVDNVKCNENDYIMKEGGGHMKEGEPASAAAAEVDKAEVARANDDEERKSKLMDSKAIAAVDRFQDRLNDKLLTGSLDTNTNINPHEDSDADDDINGDIENQTQTTQTLIEAYAVPDDDEQAEIIGKLHEQLARTQTKLEFERTRSQLELERTRSQLWEGVSVVEGVPVSDILDSNKKKQIFMTIGVVLFLSTVAVVVGLAVFFTNQNDNGNEPLNSEAEAAAQVHPHVLEALQDHKVLRCGIEDRFGFSSINNETNERVGFEVDLCKAVAAAALGSSYRYEIVPTTRTNRFVKLANGDFDVLISGTTHTFDRDVHEVSSGIGLTFSTPYLYGGMFFKGVPKFVTCADKLSVIGECANIRICSCISTTWYDKTKHLFPASNIVVTEDQQQSIKHLIEGKCDVIQGEQYEAPEPLVRALGYDGPYAQGVNSFTKEPLAMVTRDGDPEFADFVELVLQSVLHAEAQNVTMMTADTFTQTGEFFGDEYKVMFQNALAAVGNYGEIYARHLEPISARLKVNTINHGETGLLYSHPFGKVDTVGPGPVKGGVIESILERGFLRCGIPFRNSNSSSVLEDAQELTSDYRVGLDMEFCRALSASILQRAPDNVLFKSFPASEYGNISLALENGDIDVYARGEVNMNSNIIITPGLSFSRPYFYEGRGNSTAEKAFSLVTKESDAQWTSLVYWVVMATIDAEENGITQMTSNEMPLVSLFGTGLKRLLRDAILAVGNYDEMYRRVFGQNATRVGRNMLNASPFGPEHYPLPFGERLADTDESR